jgi:hypothetical protein
MISIALLILLLVAPGSQPMANPANAIGGPRMTISFTYGSPSEHCASQMHLAYSYPNAPAAFKWRARVRADSDKVAMDPNSPDIYDDLTLVGPASKATVVSLNPNATFDYVDGGLETITYHGALPVMHSLFGLQVARPCRSTPGSGQIQLNH